jgi:GT2 family glycosyltransferase
MDAGTAQVAVVIPSWNSVRLLPACLASVRAQEPAPEVFVVDNGSTDGSVAWLEREGIPHLTLPRNEGFAAAVDLGASRTEAPYVLPLNADTELEPGAVAALLAALEADPGLGGVAPRILQVEGESRDVAKARLYSAGQALTRDGRAVEIRAGEAQTAEDRAVEIRAGGAQTADDRPGGVAAGGRRWREIFGVCGAACLLRRDLFTDLGGYDKSFFAFYEDVDLNVRAQIAGHRFEYVPEAVVWHLGNASWLAEAPRPGAWNARLVARNRLVTQARFMPATAIPRIAVVEAGALLRAAREGRLGATLRGKLEGLRRLPEALRERRRLAATGDLSRPRAWLGRRDL